MTRIIKNFITREFLLVKAFNEGLKDFPTLRKIVCFPDEPVKDFLSLVDLVIEAEKQGLVYIKKSRIKKNINHRIYVRWYLARFEAAGKIQGFTGKVGRPKGSNNVIKSVFDS